ncbi:MAG: hypothetical protein ACKVVT_18210 [Dehalococcoidia bacterium]
MDEEPARLRAAVDRNAAAVVAGNFPQLMADITPEALAQLMALAPQGGGLSLTSMPNISGHEVTPIRADGDSFVYHVAFQSDAGTATIAATWREVLGQWKVVALALVAIQPKA